MNTEQIDTLLSFQGSTSFHIVTWKHGEPTGELFRVARMNGARIVATHEDATVCGPITALGADYYIGVDFCGGEVAVDAGTPGLEITVHAPKVEHEWVEDAYVIADSFNAYNPTPTLWERTESGWRDGFDNTLRTGEMRNVVRLSGEVLDALAKNSGVEK